MVKDILDKFWLDFDEESNLMIYIIMIVMCNIVVFSVLVCRHFIILGTVCALVSGFSAFVAVKMGADNMDQTNKVLYYIYLLASEILCGVIFLHIAWWLFNIPFNIAKYRNENPKPKSPLKRK